MREVRLQIGWLAMPTVLLPGVWILQPGQSMGMVIIICGMDMIMGLNMMMLSKKVMPTLSKLLLKKVRKTGLPWLNGK